jgi:hypothetical protein
MLAHAGGPAADNPNPTRAQRTSQRAASACNVPDGGRGRCISDL